MSLLNTPLLIAGVFLFGLLIGSFLNVVILRLPRMMEYEWRCQCEELLADLDGSGTSQASAAGATTEKAQPPTLTHPNGAILWMPSARWKRAK